MEIGKLHHLGYTFTEIPFDNVVYEYHSYAPDEFTMQTSNTSYKLTYPQDSMAIIPADAQTNYVNMLNDAAQYNNGSSNTWQVLTNNIPEAVPNSNINIGNMRITLNNLASNTTVTVDEIKVSEYDKSNNFIKDVFYEDFSSNFDYELLETGTGVLKDAQIQSSTNGGYSGSNAKIIQGPTGPNNTSGVDDAIMFRDWNLSFFKINPNNKYQVSVRVKVQNPGPNTVVKPVMIYYNCDGVTTLNKSGIEAALQPYIDYSNQKNVPIFMGEYGVTNWCFKEIKNVSNGTLYTSLGNLGGEQWINDMLSVISDKGLNSSYWCYSEAWEEIFGLYVGPLQDWKMYINEYLENAFMDYLGGF